MSDIETSLVRSGRGELERRRDVDRGDLDRRELLRQRFLDSRARLHTAVSQARQQARGLTPAAHIREDPWRWVLGAMAVGFLLARLTRPRRR